MAVTKLEVMLLELMGNFWVNSDTSKLETKCSVAMFIVHKRLAKNCYVIIMAMFLVTI